MFSNHFGGFIRRMAVERKGSRPFVGREVKVQRNFFFKLDKTQIKTKRQTDSKIIS
jgi:hypothetical protein